MAKTTKIKVRKGMPSVALDKTEFKKRFLARFYDPDYDPLMPELDKIVETAWLTYEGYHKSPRTRKAGKGFADPDFDVPIEWLETRANVQAAERRQKNPKSPSRVLIVNGSSRNDQTCPGEMSKTWRLVTMAQRSDRGRRAVSRSRYSICRASPPSTGAVIYPCKACVSTAQPLCHWPCSLLSQPCARPGRRLDGGDLSAMGGRARRDDRHAR